LYGLSQNIGKDVKEERAIVVADGKDFQKNEAKSGDSWSFYPNPVEDVLYVTGLEGFYTIKIVDAVGQMVATVKGTAAEQQFDMRDNSPGMYLLKVESQGKSFTRKLIKK